MKSAPAPNAPCAETMILFGNKGGQTAVAGSGDEKALPPTTAGEEAHQFHS